MKLLSTYSDNAAFEEEKDTLELNNDYAALAIEERDVHMKEIPDMVDIALWDNTEEKLFMIRGWEYDTDVYPTDRYIPIGVEVIPKSHMDDGHARIMSLVYMNPHKPINGDNSNTLMPFGLYNVQIGIENSSYTIPYIANSENSDFGNLQNIKGWSNDFTNKEYLPSDSLKQIINPFTKNQGYYKDDNIIQDFCPSPYLENMTRNPIFFTENPDAEHPSCLLNMDGKGETTKILNQLNKNLGNEDWKTGSTIPSYTSETLGWDKIAPAAQSCWMYCVDEKYKDNPIFGQGQWYLPTIGEICYIIARFGAINASIAKCNKVRLNTAVWYHSSSSLKTINNMNTNFSYCYLNDGGSRSLSNAVRSFCLI